jgi:transcriptional regulator with XRE-family HTH domain
MMDQGIWDPGTLGARLRVLRRWRRLTQQELADMAELSPSFLSMVERGDRALDRRSHISALASALRVSETDLVGGPHLSADPVQAAPHTTIPTVRAALLTNTLTSPAVERARPLQELVEEMRRIDRSEYKHPVVGEKLPQLLGELHVHAAAPEDERAYRLALETLIEAFQTATFCAKDLKYGDLATVAAMRAAEVAKILDDPVTTGKANSLKVHTMPPNARDEALALAEDAANALEPHARDDHAVQVLGMLSLAAALSSTVIFNKDRAAHWLDQASSLAERVPDTPGENWGAFSRSNVAVWKVSLATERGDSGGTLLELARDVDEDVIAPRRGRHASFLADMGRGLARDRKTRKQAAQWLLRAESVAPHKIRNSGAVAETVAVMLRQSRDAAVGRELRGLAARLGVPH